MCGEHTRNTWRTVCDYVVNIPQNANKQSVKYATNTPLGVGADSSCPYPYVTKNVYFHNQICISTLLNTYIHFTKYVFPHYCIRVFISPYTCFRSSFYGCIRICGHDKSAPTAANGLPKHCWRIAIMQRTPTKYIRNTHEIGCEHSVRRRGRFIAPVSLRNQKRIFP